VLGCGALGADAVTSGFAVGAFAAAGAPNLSAVLEVAGLAPHAGFAVPKGAPPAFAVNGVAAGAFDVGASAGFLAEPKTDANMRREPAVDDQ